MLETSGEEGARERGKVHRRRGQPTPDIGVARREPLVWSPEPPMLQDARIAALAHDLTMTVATHALPTETPGYVV